MACTRSIFHEIEKSSKISTLNHLVSWTVKQSLTVYNKAAGL